MGVERKSRGRKIRLSPRRRAAPRTFGQHKRTQTPVVRPVGPERGPRHPAVGPLRPAECNASRGAFSVGTAGALIDRECPRPWQDEGQVCADRIAGWREHPNSGQKKLPLSRLIHGWEAPLGGCQDRGVHSDSWMTCTEPCEVLKSPQTPRSCVGLTGPRTSQGRLQSCNGGAEEESQGPWRRERSGICKDTAQKWAFASFLSPSWRESCSSVLNLSLLGLLSCERHPAPCSVSAQQSDSTYTRSEMIATASSANSYHFIE